MKSKTFISVLLVVLALVIGYFTYLRPTFSSMDNNIKQLKYEVDSLDRQNELLEIIDRQRDSLITELVKQNDNRLDSVHKMYYYKYKNLRSKYEGKINNVSNLSIDDNIKLFTELISKEDSTEW